jgi:hypothetical protein
MSLRNKDERDMATLDRIQREGGFTLSWLISNRDNAASLHRLVASGYLKIDSHDWLPCTPEKTPNSQVESPAPNSPTLMQRIGRWLGGEDHE